MQKEISPKFFLLPRHSINFSKKEVSLLVKGILKNVYISGNCTDVFEKNFARYIDTKFAISTVSARVGLFLILKFALRLLPGDEVILPAYSFWAVVETIKLLGLKAVFVDINPYTYSIDPFFIKEKITFRTKAIIVEHIFGQPADLRPIIDVARENSLYLIEDCAQACGSEFNGKKVGSFGDINYFSFAKGKNLTTIFGGMITTNNDVLAQRLYDVLKKNTKPYSSRKVKFKAASSLVQYILTTRSILYSPVYLLVLLNAHDFSERPHPLNLESISHPTRLSDFQSCIGLEQLKRVDGLNDERIKNSLLLKEGIGDFNGIFLQADIPDVKHTYSCFSLRIKETRVAAKRLLLKGIDVRRDWMSYYGKEENLRHLSDQIIYLPNYPTLNEKKIRYIILNTREVINGL